MARVLGRVRLSRNTEETSSPERQREAIETWAAGNGHEVIGWAEDIDVSRSVRPFDSPELSPWLSQPEQIGSWDVIATYRLDRLATGSVYLNELIKWSTENTKVIVSTSENLDFSTWVGEMVANVIAGVARGELEAIRERTTNAFDWNYRRGKYTGGAVPYGYWIVDGEYAVDHEAKTVLLRIVEDIIAGTSIRQVRMDLNDKQVTPPSDRRRINNGKPTKGVSWGDTAITDMLRSEAMLG